MKQGVRTTGGDENGEEILWTVRIGQTLIVPMRKYEECCTHSYLLQERKSQKTNEGETKDAFANTKWVKHVEENTLRLEEEAVQILKPMHRGNEISVFKCPIIETGDAESGGKCWGSTSATALFNMMRMEGSESVTISTGISNEEEDLNEKEEGDKQFKLIVQTLKMITKGNEPKLIIVPRRRE